MSSRAREVFLAVGIVLLAFAPVHASAAGTGSVSGAGLAEGGSISGTVKVQYGLDFGGTCMLDVSAYDSMGSVTTFSNWWFSDDYKLTKLDPGTYRLGFYLSCAGPFQMGFPVSHIGEFFNDKQTLAAATPVTVIEGATTTGINVLLGEDGTISGTVTDSEGTPLDDICVEAFDSDGNADGVVAHTAGGHYVVNALDAGSYRLKFSDCLDPADPSVTSEFYDDKATLGEAVPVVVRNGSDTSGIDAQLVTKPKPPEPVVHEARIGRVKVKGPARIRKGKTATEKVTIMNSGSRAAAGVVLRIKGRGIRFHARVGSIPAGTARTVKARLKPKRAGRAKLTFKVSSSNAGRKIVKRVILVKK